MNTQLNPSPASEDALAKELVSLLETQTQQIDASTLARLAQARARALQQHKTATPLHTSGGALAWSLNALGGFFSHHRAMSGAMAVCVMAITFFAVQQLRFDANLENSDAILLASELPPEAFADKGFDAWVVAKVN